MLVVHFVTTIESLEVRALGVRESASSRDDVLHECALLLLLLLLLLTLTMLVVHFTILQERVFTFLTLLLVLTGSLLLCVLVVLTAIGILTIFHKGSFFIPLSLTDLGHIGGAHDFCTVHCHVGAPAFCNRGTGFFCVLVTSHHQ